MYNYHAEAKPPKNKLARCHFGCFSSFAKWDGVLANTLKLLEWYMIGLIFGVLSRTGLLSYFKIVSCEHLSRFLVVTDHLRPFLV